MIIKKKIKIKIKQLISNSTLYQGTLILSPFGIT